MYIINSYIYEHCYVCDSKSFFPSHVESFYMWRHTEPKQQQPHPHYVCEDIPIYLPGNLKNLFLFVVDKKNCFWGFFISIDLLCEDKWKRGEMKRKNIVLKSFMNELWINLCIEPQYITHRTKSPVTNHQPTLPATNSQLLIYS